MSALVFGLYFEGSTDKVFLPPVIRRITREVLACSQGRETYDIIVTPVKPQNHGRLAEKILAAATKASGYNLLIVHSNADNLTIAEARKQRFDPGLALVRQAGKNVCQDVLPIIPVRAIEAWLLADQDTLLSALGTDKSARELGIPPLRQIESTARPKERLEDSIWRVNRSRPQSQLIRRNDLYELLGEAVRLSELAHLSAYTQFTADLTQALIETQIIPYASL